MVFEIADCASLGKQLDLLHDLLSEAASFARNRLVGHHAKLSERDDEQLLEVGDLSVSRIGAVRMRAVA